MTIRTQIKIVMCIKLLTDTLCIIGAGLAAHWIANRWLGGAADLHMTWVCIGVVWLYWIVLFIRLFKPTLEAMYQSLWEDAIAEMKAVRK